MTEETIRQFLAGQFTTIPVPDWLERGERLRVEQRLDREEALSRVLEVEQQGFTIAPTGPIGLEINFWHSFEEGVYVEIESGLGLIEQVLVRDPNDWLPFMSAHLTPLLTAIAQAATAQQLERLTNAVIAFGRHGEGEHIQRGTGESQIDETRDAAAFARVRSRGVL
jgi:hypothetical protein